MKRFLLAGATLALIACSPAARAQLFGSGIVFDPTQSAHAIEQISQGEQIFTNTVKIADNAIAAYNLAYEMSMAPQMLYKPYISRFDLLDGPQPGCQHLWQFPIGYELRQHRGERVGRLSVRQRAANRDSS